MKNFNSLAKSITVEFDCMKCGTTINETFEDLPVADMLADNASGSENSTEETIVCPECGEEYTCDIYVNMYEGNVEITSSNRDVVDDVAVEETYNEE